MLGAPPVHRPPYCGALPLDFQFQGQSPRMRSLRLGLQTGAHCTPLLSHCSLLSGIPLGSVWESRVQGLLSLRDPCHSAHTSNRAGCSCPTESTTEAGHQVQLQILLFCVGGNNGETAAALVGPVSRPPWVRRRPTGACGKGSEVRLRIVSDMTFSHHGRRFHQQQHIGNK